MPADPERKRRYKAEWQRRNHVKMAEYRKRWRDKNRHRINGMKRDWYARRGQTERGYRLRRSYGITQEQFRAMVDERGGRCDVCRRVPRGRGASAMLQVDHDHATGAVRGLLCTWCNTAIGKLMDDADICDAAAAYLRAHNAKPKNTRSHGATRRLADHPMLFGEAPNG